MPRRYLIVAIVVAGLTACSPGPVPSPTVQAPVSTPAGASPAPPASPVGARPPACGDASLVYDPGARRLLLVTCVDQANGQASEQVWAWDGQGWRLIDGDGPPPLVVTGVAFDTDREVLVRYGGLPLTSNDCVRETWEWGGSGWHEASAGSAPGPTACDHMKLAYDANQRVTVLVGGGQLQELSPETWAWDGKAWTRRSETGPAPRAHAGLVYDDAHHQTVLYGGYDGSRVFDDFWTWDGAAWTQIDFPGPGPRSHAGLAISDDAVLLLFGGATGPSTFSTLTADTWVLDDGRWSSRQAAGPSPRGSPALGYDPGRGVWVLYGGFGPDGGELGDTWEWDGSSWRCADRC